jgi:hypothetical protein
MLAVFGFGPVELLVVLFGMGLGVLAFAFWIWMLVDCIRNRGLGADEKLIWVLVIALTHFVGALIYLAIGYPKNLPGHV